MKTVFSRRWLAVVGIFGLARADEVTLKPTADTTLFAFAPDNNAGRESSVVLGGINKAASACRVLVRFGLETNLPPGAVITDVTLKLAVTRENGGGAPLQAEWHRLLRPWGEGAKTGRAAGNPASAGEATWKSRQHGQSTWTAAGGDGDFVPVASAIRSLDNSETVTVASTPGLLGDVRLWLAQPTNNFGWLILAPGEVTPGSARRLASREASTGAMTLRIVYTVPAPVPALKVTISRVADGLLEVSFPGRVGFRYTIQRQSPALGALWEDLSAFRPLSEQLYRQVLVPAVANEFFRVVVKPSGDHVF